LRGFDATNARRQPGAIEASIDLPLAGLLKTADRAGRENP